MTVTPRIEGVGGKNKLISKIRIREAIKKKFDDNGKNHTQLLNEKFVFWCRMELISLMFSMAGLFLAIFEYEYLLFTNDMDNIYVVSTTNPN